jgi:hypothetical protein
MPVVPMAQLFPLDGVWLPREDEPIIKVLKCYNGKLVALRLGADKISQQRL